MNIDELIVWLFLRGFKIISIILFAIIAMKIGTFVIKRGVRSLIGNNRENERKKTLIGVFNSTFKASVIIVALLTILPEMGINIGPLLATAGIAGLAIGMGARNLIQDYFSGIFILLEDQYRIGEEVTLLGIKGTISDFNLRRTVLRGEDNSLHIIPNGQINRVNNFSRR